MDEGTLSVLSPSGVKGQLSTGAGAVLPASAPLVASNDADTDAAVLFAGVVELGRTRSLPK